MFIRDDNGAFQPPGIGGMVAGGWSLAFIGPTAAGISVSGQVRAGKTPIKGASVMITGGDLTAPLFAKINNFGNYNFEGLTAG